MVIINNLLLFRYFEDVTSHTGVDMDDSFTGLPLNLGTYAFGSSFTVSMSQFTYDKNLLDLYISPVSENRPPTFHIPHTYTN